MIHWDDWLKIECKRRKWKCHIRCRRVGNSNGRLYYAKIMEWAKPNDLLEIIELVEETRLRALCGTKKGARVTSCKMPGSITFVLNEYHKGG